MSKRNRKSFAIEELLTEMETDQVINDVSAITGAESNDPATLEKVAEVNEKADAAKAEDEAAKTDTAAGSEDSGTGTADDTEGATDDSDGAGDDGGAAKTDESSEEKKDDGSITDSEEEPLSTEEKEEVTAAVEELMENADPTTIVTDEDMSVIENSLLDREDVVVEAMATANTLEDIACALDSTISVGGIKPVEAPAVRAAVGVVLETAGTDLEPTFLATESLNPSKRINTTKMAIESIMGHVKDIWEAIVKFLTKLVNWVKEHVKSFFDSAKANEIKLQSLKKSMSTFKGVFQTAYFTEDDKGEEIKKHKELADKFIIPTKGIGADADFVASTQAFISTAETFCESVGNAHKNITALIFKILDEKTDVRGMQNALGVKSLLGNSWKSIAAIPGYEVIPDLETYTTGVLPGGTRLCAYVPKTDTNIVKSIEQMREAKIMFAQQRTVIPYKLKYLEDKADIENAIDGLLAVNSIYKESNSMLLELSTVKNKIILRLGKDYNVVEDNFNKTPDKDKELSTADTKKLASYLILSLSRFYDSPTANFTRILNNYVKSGTEFVRMSMQRGMK